MAASVRNTKRKHYHTPGVVSGNLARDLSSYELERRLEQTREPRERCLLQDRIRMLSTMVREARELAVLTEHYYDRGYRRNVRYTV